MADKVGRDAQTVFVVVVVIGGMYQSLAVVQGQVVDIVSLVTSETQHDVLEWLSLVGDDAEIFVEVVGRAEVGVGREGVGTYLHLHHAVDGKHRHEVVVESAEQVPSLSEELQA